MIQSGIHYSELLQKEWEPSSEYLRLFEEIMGSFSPVIAQLVATVSTQIVKDKWENTVLVSLARAGTPIGILIKRYIKERWGFDVSHYTISIIRDKGIDKNAMDYIVNKHGEKWIQFVDGWTGKGTIKKQLNESLAKYYTETGHRIKPDLAVLSDPARVADKWGTREDVLISNACLNANISGGLSRTFLKDGIVGKNDFHGCAFYKDLKGSDYTYTFIDGVVKCFSKAKYITAKDGVIMPLNNVAGVNRTFNTVAICQKCNSSKSDSVDYRVVKGYLAKLFEVFTSHLPDALALVLSLIVSLAYQIFNLLFILVTMPLTLANGKFLTYAVVIVIIFAFIFSKL